MIEWLKNLNWTLFIAAVALILSIFNTVRPLIEKPVLKGDFLHVMTGETMPVIKINQLEYPCSLFIYFYVTNYSTKPVRLSNKYKLYITVKRTNLDLFGKTIEALPSYFDPDTLRFAEGRQPVGFDFKKDYLLIKDNLDPVVYGGIVKGWVSFISPMRSEEFMKKGTKFLLIVEDIFKRKHKIKYVFQEGEKGTIFFPISQMAVP